MARSLWICLRRPARLYRRDKDVGQEDRQEKRERVGGGEVGGLGEGGLTIVNGGMAGARIFFFPPPPRPTGAGAPIW